MRLVDRLDAAMFETVLRPALYRASRSDPERVHDRALAGLGRLTRFGPALALLRARYGHTAPMDVCGLRFANPVGLAAGMDKDGQALAAWPALGFGFVELGTVTRWPQPGNPEPRLFQLPRSGALINRMGFNNAGAAALAQRLASSPAPVVPLGISIGRTKAIPAEQTVADYVASLELLHPYADYFAINVSSPNTPGLRGLQRRDALTDLLDELHRTSVALAERAGRSRPPLLVKVDPDMPDEALREVVTVCAEHHVAGIIATNTTLGRDGLAATERGCAAETGGLSGRPLAQRSQAVVRSIHEHTGGTMPIIGVGGIHRAEDALRLMDAGASLVQLYTGFIYSGPALVTAIARALGQR